MEFDICRIDDYEKFEKKYFTVLMDGLHPYYAGDEIFDYDGNELLICGNTSLLKSSGYSPINFTTLDSTFEDKLKSKLLVLDYDIASKLNFFTDAGEYRLPNSLNFNSDNISTENRDELDQKQSAEKHEK